MTAAQLQRECPRLLRAVAEGFTVVVTEGGRPTARIVPVTAARLPRRSAMASVTLLAADDEAYFTAT